MARALLIDLDGVLRVWPPDFSAVGELSSAVVNAALFEPDLLERAVTGQISDEQWRREAAGKLKADHGVDCASALVEAAGYPGELRVEVLALCRRARAVVPVCLVTNATSRLDEHLVQLSIAGEFDQVFNSSEMGVSKPDGRIFELACGALGLDTAEVVFVDDTARHVTAAASVGLHAHLFTTVDELEKTLLGEGILF